MIASGKDEGRVQTGVESTQIRKWYEAKLRKVKRWHSMSNCSLVPRLSCMGGAWEGGFKQPVIRPLS